MSHFIYKAKKPSGEIYKGEKDAEDRYQLYKILKESGDEVVEKALEAVCKTRRILMNRQPTLHKYGVMCLKPVPLYGEKCIRVPPLICSPFNADLSIQKSAWN
jgi:DNA-directed RNA polymerase beta' subunit